VSGRAKNGCCAFMIV